MKPENIKGNTATFSFKKGNNWGIEHYKGIEGIQEHIK